VVKLAFPALSTAINRKTHYVTARALMELYPDKTPDEREDLVAKKYGTVFVMGIGGALADGAPHGNRAPDYDDWGLNGDLILYNAVLDEKLELSSMGIRVDAASLSAQLANANAESRLKFAYHKAIIDKQLPLTIGGGIGQSRLCMHLLQKLHIGEVQASIWPQAMMTECRKFGIPLL